MTLEDNIAMVKPYFEAFNVMDEVMYVKASFPSKWVLPETGENDTVKLVKDPKDGGVYFFTDLENGNDVIFKAITQTINMNKDIEEKTQLLVQKAEELKELFAVEPIEKLRLLEFTFRRQKKGLKKAPIQARQEPQEEKVVNPAPAEEKVPESEKIEAPKSDADELMDIAKDLV